MIFPPDLATTMWDLVGCPGVALGLLKPATPAFVNLGSFLLVAIVVLSSAVRSLGFAVQPNLVLRVPLCVAIGVPLPPLLLLHLFVT